MHAHRTLVSPLITALLCCIAAPVARVARGQDSVRVVAPCDGRTVTGFDISPGRPPFAGVAKTWRTIARSVGLHHATTKADVIASFMALHVGRPCTERRRAESERILRAQPFIADARVRMVPDGRGGVRAEVATVDEISVLVSGRFHGASPQELTIGNSNIAGEGLSVQLRGERGIGYRTGFGTIVRKYGMFDRPYVATFEAQRNTLGHVVDGAFEHPFYTDLQRIGWHLGIRSSDEYPRLRRPARDPLALEIRQERWDASSLTRVFGTTNVWLLGIGASGLRLTPAAAGVVVTDTGLAADTGVTLRNRYRAFRSGRVGGIAALRRVKFRPVSGFDGLAGQQDAANGVMTGLFVAKGLPSMGESDLFASGAAYAGWSGSRSLLTLLAQAEARRGEGNSEWDDIVGSGRAAFYLGEPGTVFMIEDRYSTASRALLPSQFALGDVDGGIMGYRATPLAGARRNALHTELRLSRSSLIRGADVGIAPFAEVGSVWAGDAPYGMTATRSAIGFSILAAYPTQSKRLYRADFGFPLRRGGGAGIEVRVSSEDRSSEFWTEPHDVERVRTGAVPVSLFAWQRR